MTTTQQLLVRHDLVLSPLDLMVAPNGNVVVSSERPFGAPDAVTSVREYHAESGRLVRVLSAEGLAGFRKPRGLRFGRDGNLYCVAKDEAVAFDFQSDRCPWCGRAAFTTAWASTYFLSRLAMHAAGISPDVGVTAAQDIDAENSSASPMAQAGYEIGLDNFCDGSVTISCTFPATPA